MAKRLGEEKSHLAMMTRNPNKSTTYRTKDLDAKIDSINIGSNVPVTIDSLIRQTGLPFT